MNVVVLLNSKNGVINDIEIEQPIYSLILNDMSHLKHCLYSLENYINNKFYFVVSYEDNSINFIKNEIEDLGIYNYEILLVSKNNFTYDNIINNSEITKVIENSKSTLIYNANKVLRSEDISKTIDNCRAKINYINCDKIKKINNKQIDIEEVDLIYFQDYITEIQTKNYYLPEGNIIKLENFQDCFKKDSNILLKLNDKNKYISYLKKNLMFKELLEFYKEITKENHEYINDYIIFLLEIGEFNLGIDYINKYNINNLAQTNSKGSDNAIKFKFFLKTVTINQNTGRVVLNPVNEGEKELVKLLVSNSLNTKTVSELETLIQDVGNDWSGATVVISTIKYLIQNKLIDETNITLIVNLVSNALVYSPFMRKYMFVTLFEYLKENRPNLLVYNGWYNFVQKMLILCLNSGNEFGVGDKYYLEEFFKSNKITLLEGSPKDVLKTTKKSNENDRIALCITVNDKESFKDNFETYKEFIIDKISDNIDIYISCWKEDVISDLIDKKIISQVRIIENNLTKFMDKHKEYEQLNNDEVKLKEYYLKYGIYQEIKDMEYDTIININSSACIKEFDLKNINKIGVNDIIVPNHVFLGLDDYYVIGKKSTMLKYYRIWEVVESNKDISPFLHNGHKYNLTANNIVNSWISYIKIIPLVGQNLTITNK